MYKPAYMHAGASGDQKEGSRGAEVVTGGCELPDAGNRTQILCKSSAHSVAPGRGSRRVRLPCLCLLMFSFDKLEAEASAKGKRRKH